MDIKILQYQIEHNGYTTKASLHKDSWTITCRSSDAPNIPPYTSILTIAGWQNTLKHNATVRKFDSIEDVQQFLEDYS